MPAPGTPLAAGRLSAGQSGVLAVNNQRVMIVWAILMASGLSLVQLAALELFIGEAGRVDHTIIVAGAVITLLGAWLSMNRHR